MKKYFSASSELYPDMLLGPGLIWLGTSVAQEAKLMGLLGHLVILLGWLLVIKFTNAAIRAGKTLGWWKLKTEDKLLAGRWRFRSVLAALAGEIIMLGGIYALSQSTLLVHYVTVFGLWGAMFILAIKAFFILVQWGYDWRNWPGY